MGQPAMQQQQPTDNWAVPLMTRQKYQAQFANTDRNRTGFLAGAQARNILLQVWDSLKIQTTVRNEFVICI